MPRKYACHEGVACAMLAVALQRHCHTSGTRFCGGPLTRYKSEALCNEPSGVAGATHALSSAARCDILPSAQHRRCTSSARARQAFQVPLEREDLLASAGTALAARVLRRLGLARSAHSNRPGCCMPAAHCTCGGSAAADLPPATPLAVGDSRKPVQRQ
jgi:hypothetical protein